jgi:hypothetical protein
MLRFLFLDAARDSELCAGRIKELIVAAKAREKNEDSVGKCEWRQQVFLGFDYLFVSAADFRNLSPKPTESISPTFTSLPNAPKIFFLNKIKELKKFFVAANDLIETYYTFSYPWVSLRPGDAPTSACCKSPFKSRVIIIFFSFLRSYINNFQLNIGKWIFLLFRCILDLISVHDQIESDNFVACGVLSL